MSNDLNRALARLLAARRRGARLALLLDYDGTLTPIAEHPRLARLGRGTRLLLRLLAQRPGVRLGVLSGRSLDDLKGMVGLPGLLYGGLSGLELEVGGERSVAPGAEAGREVVREAVDHLRVLAAEYVGSWVEEKGFGLTFHYRSAAPSAAEEACARARDVLARWAGRFRVLHGLKALEATLALGRTQGTAVRAIVEGVGRPVLPLYAGDGENDLDALSAVSDLGGVAIGVGPDAPSTAKYRLASPADLLNWLRHLLLALELLPAYRAAARTGTESAN
jgi:trehalose 6-phosphate phosphatase